ncbi:MAG: ABC transporter permease [Spirochaetia bacterium]|nr:ABC transporter permease [Spirochaetia bacterium]
MDVFTLLRRNILWRLHNAFTIIVTILQPMLWLVLYSSLASQVMQGIGIENYTAFLLPGLMILTSFGACSSNGIMNYLMKADGSFYRILIAPVRRKAIVLGQLLEAVACTGLEVMIMCIVSLFFSVRVASGLPGILLIALLVCMTAFFLSGLTYTISLCLPNEVAYETVMNAIALPIFFLSTALLPENSLSGSMALAVDINPFTHVINTLRTLVLQENIEIHTVVPTIIMLSVMCCISFSWAVHKLKKQTDL